MPQPSPSPTAPRTRVRPPAVVLAVALTVVLVMTALTPAVAQLPGAPAIPGLPALPPGRAPAPSPATDPAPFAPLDRPGPALQVERSRLEAALRCSATVGPSATVDPILLLPGTTVEPESNFSWNWFKALDAAQRPYCSVELPANATGDIQVAAEYVVFALRQMNQMVSTTPDLDVDVVGHSQGGMITRWALRFWPDTRALVDDLVGLAPSNHGTVLAPLVCLTGCAAALHQQAVGSMFMQALNSGTETFAGIDYTNVWTQLDQVVVPARGAELSVGDGRISNIRLQDVCPTAVVEHLGIGTYDGAAHAIAMDALDHDGPADPARIDRGVCAQPFMPGVDPVTFPTDVLAAGTILGTTVALGDRLFAEPPLAGYVMADAP